MCADNDMIDQSGVRADRASTTDMTPMAENRTGTNGHEVAHYAINPDGNIRTDHGVFAN
jgi:hypothetical protein